jgi:hypothetical protein
VFLCGPNLKLYNEDQWDKSVSRVKRGSSEVEDWELRIVKVLTVHSQAVSQLHQVLIGFSDLSETCVGQSAFYRLHFMWCVHCQLLFGESSIGEVYHPAAVVFSAVRNNKTSGESECTPRWWSPPEPGFWKYWRQKLSSPKSQCHVIMNKYPEAASAVQQVHRVLSDIENLTKCTP